MNADSPLNAVALYNPHLLSSEEVIRLFVARRNLLDRLLEDLRQADSGIPQSHLIVGQRGMGKTMLLRRLALAIEGDEALAKQWIPLTFPEEQYEVANLSGFWRNCADALGDALERRGDPTAADALDQALDELPAGDEARRSDAALALLLDSAKEAGHRLVLLVDNVDMIFDRIGDQQWALREALSTSPNLALIGASAQAVEATYQYDKSFYELLRIHDLSGLDLEETKRFLLHYAESLDKSFVQDAIEDNPGRLEALHVLTAGNPRTLVLLFQLLGQGADGDVRTDLEQMLDHSTPLYKARLEALSKQSQRIVHALAVHWYPATAKEVAESLGLKVNAASAQLDRLAQQGIVQKDALAGTKKVGFRLAERFFNIWYLMRASRRVRRKLVWLVEFLRIMYRPGRPCQHAPYEAAVAAYRKVIKRSSDRGAARGVAESGLANTFYGNRINLGESEQLAREAASLDERPEAACTLAASLVSRDKWNEAAPHALQFLSGGGDFLQNSFEDVLLFFQETVVAGRAADAGALLDEANLNERWLPLREAIETVARGDRTYLRNLPPEVRKPTEDLLDRLVGPEWQGGEAEALPT